VLKNPLLFLYNNVVSNAKTKDMKYTTVHLDNNKIELFNSVFGKETIKVNNEIVSEKRSIMGTEHLFKIKENDNEVECKLVTGFGLNGVVFDLYKDKKPIIESPKNNFIGIILIVGFTIIIIGAIERILS
jgi:hypothetical protein